MKIETDKNAGFCWGVVQTIDKVEDTLSKNPHYPIAILGEIIHNPQEIKRLADKGLHTVSEEDLETLDKSTKLIIRAHGEPPSTYKIVKNLNLDLIDATCPLVKALQDKVRKFYISGYQIIIFGKKNHAEIIGLRGVCDDNCIVVKSCDVALDAVDLQKKTVFLSQTTMDGFTFDHIAAKLKEKFDEKGNSDLLTIQKTICRFVIGREDNLSRFAKEHQIIIFVAGKNSSNGKSLYQICTANNSNSYFIENADELKDEWFVGIDSVGITGATSTPKWYLEEIKNEIIKSTDKQGK